MATPPRNDTSQTAQAGVTLLLVREVRALIQGLDPRRVRESLPGVTAAVSTLVQRYGAANATLAARHYSEVRRLDVPGKFVARPADPAPLGQVSAMVNWATVPLSPDLLAPAPPEQAIKQVEKRLVDGAERLVLNQSRMTTVENAQRDRKARGWAREVRPGCCSFCALMATRGPAYRSEATAGAEANAKFLGEGKFKFHNNCHCTVVPVFGAFEPSAVAREAEAAYKNRGKGDALNAFRREWEARNRALSLTPQPAR